MDTIARKAFSSLIMLMLCIVGDSGKNLEDFDHGGEKVAYCRYQLGLYYKTPAKSVYFSFFTGSFYGKLGEPPKLLVFSTFKKFLHSIAIK